MLKKYLLTKESPQPTIQSYLQQANGFRKTPHKKTNGLLLSKAALAAFIPLVAASTVNAQCPGPTSIKTYNNTGSNSIIKYVTFNATSCSVAASKNVFSCINQTSFFLGRAATSAVSASCTFSCPCGTITIDSNDGLGAGPVLLVDLVDFRAVPALSSLILNWKTLAELNNSGFEILRSTNGRTYQKVAWVAGHGTSNEPKAYQWIDKAIRPNTNYFYRLNQIDRDGTNEYSKVVTTMLTDEKIIEVSEVFPNPVSETFAKLRVNTPISSIANIHLFDGRGTQINEAKKALKKGTNIFRVQLGDLIPGTYYAKIQVEQEMWYRKILVQ